MLRPIIVGLLLLSGMGAATAAQLSENEARIYRSAVEAAKGADLAGAERDAQGLHDSALVLSVRWLALTRGGGSFSDITAFIDAHPDWPSQTTLEKHAEEQAANAPDNAALAWFDAHPPITQAGKLREAELWLDHGKSAEGTKLIRDVWIDGDFTAFDERSFLQRYRDFIRPTDHVARLDRLLWDDQIEEARRELLRVDDGERAAGLARIALAQEDGGAERLVARVPAALQDTPGLVYERVRWRRRNDHYDDAIALLSTVRDDPTRPDSWAVEREILARFALAEDKDSEAFRIADEHGELTGAHFAELEFLAGWIALRDLKQPETAYDHFVRLYDDVKLPISRGRGAYWSARAADAMGYRQLANAWYGTAAEQITTYYGQLAAAQIGAPGASRIAEPQPTREDAAHFNTEPLVKTTRAMAQIGADDTVTHIVRHMADNASDPVTYALVARLGTELERPDLAIMAAKRAGYAGVTLLAAGYPIEAMPATGGVERPLVLAMTRQESAFDAGAVSTAGARGLMQLMPATASIMAKEMGVRFSAKRLTTDVHYNLALGQHYLDGLLGNFTGSYVLAVAAYNAGPARVQEWMHDFGDPRAKNADAIDWVESIPIAETRNYVQRVLENLQVYRYRMGDRRLAFSLESDLRR